nr:hypothetical protein [Methylobacterium sp.]USU34715.1 hypothetical protein NG677_24270 [Methylobacterium sp.]
MAGTAMANERIDITPKLYREQARATGAVRPTFELTTTRRPPLRSSKRPHPQQFDLFALRA